MGAWGSLPVEGSGGNRHNRLSQDAITFQNDRTFPLPDHKTNYPTKPLAGCSSVSDQQTIEMEGKRDDIRKGPWKAEEDQVLINHVNKYGPRDWSSIRSKGLLRRTGKSCRLRWVNKLRPNLKSGCKFTPEEERVVIELQAEFGNKWARIATYLQGRTDNDVKNFWSSRQKRLARILHNNSSSSSHPKSHRSRREALVSRQLPALEAPNFSSSWDEDSASKAQSCSSSTSYKAESSLPPLDSNTIQMVQFPDLVSQGLLDFNANTAQPEPLSAGRTQGSEVLLEMPHTELKFSSDSQVLGRFEDPYFPQLFGTVDVPELASADVGQPFFDTVRRDEPDVFFDDFPADMFDHMEALPSP